MRSGALPDDTFERLADVYVGRMSEPHRSLELDRMRAHLDETRFAGQAALLLRDVAVLDEAAYGTILEQERAALALGYPALDG